ncbi:maleate cis-trans isomerase family protein [Candidatus Foliamicus sp.]
MSDVLGWRKKFGVVGPSTNTVVQPDFDDLRPPGVTNHYSRIVIQDANAISDETFMAGTIEISENTAAAVRGVLTAKPDYLVMGMSAVTFYGGVKGGAEWKSRIEDIAQLKLSVGSEAVADALDAYGARNVAFLSPYYPVANREVRHYLSDRGFHVVRDSCLRCPSWTAIAMVDEKRIVQEFQNLDGDDVDALVQVGTNLSAIRLAAAGERWLGKPVVAINTATYWHALRTNGIKDKVFGFGRLLEEF